MEYLYWIDFFLITRYTLKNETVYAIVLEWPSSDHLNLGAPVSTADTQVTMLGYDGKFLWEPAGEKGGMVIVFPPIAVNKIPSKWAWVLKLENIKWMHLSSSNDNVSKSRSSIINH